MIKTYIVSLSLINASGFHLQNNNILNKVHVNFGKKNKNVESEYVDQQKKEKKKNTLYEPKSYNQEKYLRAINNDNIKLVICAGPAGTGKTIFATQYVADLLITQASKVVLTRPLISVDEELGYLPGDINQKMDYTDIRHSPRISTTV